MKKEIFILFMLILFFSTKLFSQAVPEIQWQKCFGGSLNETFYSIQQTADGGYIAAGRTISNDGDVHGFNIGGASPFYNPDWWIVKLNSSGNIQWQKCLGGSGSDQAWSVKQTFDGGYIATGETSSNDSNVSGNHGAYDVWVVKLNANGTIQWQKCYGGSAEDYGSSVYPTTDGGYILAAFTASNDSNVSGNHGIYDYWIVKIDSVGNMQWQKCLGGSNVDFARSVEQTKDGGYIVLGHTFSNDSNVSGNHGSWDFWAVKLNSAGNIQWQKCLGGSMVDQVGSVQQTFDDGYIVVGNTNSNDSNVSGNNGGQFDCWVVKLNSIGSIQWQKCLGGSGDDDAFAIQQTRDSGYIVSGTTNSNDSNVSGNHGDYDSWIVKLNTTGGIQWQKCLGGSGSDEAYCIRQTSDGGYIVAGTTNSNDSNVSGNHGGYDCWVVKLSAGSVGFPEIENNISSAIYPNPNTGNFVIENTLTQNSTVTFTLVNTIGKKVWSNTYSLRSGTNSTTVNINSLSSGIYFLRIEDESKQLTEVKKVFVR